MPKLIHYRQKCIGCGICHEKDPQHWRMSKKDGKATLVCGVLKKETTVKPIPEADAELSRQIARDCPVRIIKVS